MHLLAQNATAHAELNGTMPDLTVQDVRMAMQDCGVLGAESVIEDQEFEGIEDTSGVDDFILWATGPGNKEIRRVAMLDGTPGTNEDYLAGLSLRTPSQISTNVFTALKKKHNITGATGEESRYTGTNLGAPAEVRTVKVEGGDVANIKEWENRLRAVPPSKTVSLASSRRQSSALSSLGDMDEDEEMVFGT